MTDKYYSYKKIPEKMMESLKKYINEGMPVGGFLTAVLSNDLFRAVGRADDINKSLIPNYVQFLNWESPSDCHGSPEKMQAWIKKHSINRGDLSK